MEDVEETGTNSADVGDKTLSLSPQPSHQDLKLEEVIEKGYSDVFDENPSERGFAKSSYCEEIHILPFDHNLIWLQAAIVGDRPSPWICTGFTDGGRRRRSDTLSRCRR